MTIKATFTARLRVVPHFSSRIVEGAKRERFARSTILEEKWGTTRSLIYCSIARPLSPGNRFRHDSDAQQPNEQTSDSDECPPEIKRARTDDSSRSSTQSSESSSESASSSSDQEESDHSEPLPAATTPSKLLPPVVISISPDDDQQEDEMEMKNQNSL